jgi:hypothetical protein
VGGRGANEVATALRASAVSTGPSEWSTCDSIPRWSHDPKHGTLPAAEGSERPRPRRPGGKS